MTNRTSLKNDFIEHAGWQDAHISLLAGDASNRRYDRLVRADGESRVLMDAPPEKGEDIRPFVSVATYLKEIGLSAPEIFEADKKNGFLLLEDLGDNLFSSHMRNVPQDETLLYRSALDALIHLHRTPVQKLDRYSARVMSDLTGLAIEWYAANATDDMLTASPGILSDAMFKALSPVDRTQPVVILRDYHAENLIWLPDRAGVARVGLLDFQDAMSGHPLYDVVSILQDARRDVSADIEAEMLAYFMAANTDRRDEQIEAYSTLGAQRALRIIGVFARLCIRDGKQNYVDLIPRVWGLLQRNLKHPSLAAVAELVKEALPAPTPENLDRLRMKCATTPAQS